MTLIFELRRMKMMDSDDKKNEFGLIEQVVLFVVVAIIVCGILILFLGKS